LIVWDPEIKAHDITVGAVPNLLGFTVGALAIVLAFSSAEIFRVIAQGGRPDSFFMKLVSSLVHFILVQALALVVAILAKLTESRCLDILCLVLLFYAILVTFAAALELFVTARIYNARASLD
jgi:hypothetical protein